MSDDEHPTGGAEDGTDAGVCEARLKMEQEAKKRRERAEEEWKEYEEIRKTEREKEEEEITELRERRDRRKKERAEEESRLAEQRSVEEQKRRAEDEERLRKKRDEEAVKREERERKRQEFAEKSKTTGRNFVINKKAGSIDQQDEVKKEEVTKSKEQLEAERKAILEQRVQPLNTSGLSGEALKSKAKELNDLILKLEGDKYDLEQRFTRQSYDMQDLAERARQMNKGEKKSSKQTSNEPDPLASKISGIPPKVLMYSEYERVKDHRSFGDRQVLFKGPLFVERYERIEPTHTLRMTEEGLEIDDGKPPSSKPKQVEEPMEEAVPQEVAVEE